MEKTFGIRREDKNRWERRVPIIPGHVKELKSEYGIDTVVQPSGLRIYPDADYQAAGADVKEDLGGVQTVFAVKEIPVDLLAQGRTYIFFSHTIKGQPYNMKLLKRLMALKCNLIDYERIVNEKNQRLIFFGVHAGYSGMIETLYAYGQKMKLRGVDTPFANIKQAYAYGTLEAAKDHMAEIGREISEQGLPKSLCPLVVGVTGYGNVSQGAQEILDILPVRSLSPEQLSAAIGSDMTDNHALYKVVFKERDMVKPISGQFDLQDYYDHPDKYESVMGEYLPQLNILVNCIYWTQKYPRVVTRKYLKEYRDKGQPLGLAVIGDISCDIEGGIEITKTATMPDNPCFTYLPDSDAFADEIIDPGITVMAVDNLPCEFPKESSMFFSDVLKEYVNAIVSADFGAEFADVDLPYPIKKALILHNGRLTEDYAYLKKYL
ncbi:MAG: hypothetical protein HKM93_20220 [Desulfobacteraceae bacterium]|nr:hypothetical protein [Desulfobacteraceae bacterium]